MTASPSARPQLLTAASSPALTIAATGTTALTAADMNSTQALGSSRDRNSGTLPRGPTLSTSSMLIETLSVREAQEQLPSILARFRGGDRTPVGIGDHGEPVAVLIAGEIYEDLVARHP